MLLRKTAILTKILVMGVLHEGNKTQHGNKTVQNLDRSMIHLSVIVESRKSDVGGKVEYCEVSC